MLELLSSESSSIDQNSPREQKTPHTVIYLRTNANVNPSTCMSSPLIYQEIIFTPKSLFSSISFIVFVTPLKITSLRIFQIVEITSCQIIINSPLDLALLSKKKKEFKKKDMAIRKNHLSIQSPTNCIPH